MKNARFWLWYNGSWVKLTLRPGQTIRFGRSWSHDEGWASEHLKFHYDADEGVVYMDDYSDGTDCDGRLSRHFEGVCALEALASVEAWHEEGCGLPAPVHDGKWIHHAYFEQVSAYQRDYYAEAAGY